MPSEAVGLVNKIKNLESAIDVAIKALNDIDEHRVKRSGFVHEISINKCGDIVDHAIKEIALILSGT